MSTTVDAPCRVDGVQLIGEMAGSGYRTPPALVRRADGQTLQLTPLLYLVLAAVDGRRTPEEIAEVVSAKSERSVSAENITTLVDGQLRPLGLLTLADGTAPEVKRGNPLLALKLKFSVTNQRTTHLLTDPFRILFRPVVMALVVLAFAGVLWWVFFHQGLGAAAYDAFDRPHLLLLVFVVTMISAGFHEFGHAAAARYGGAEPGVMGAGIYLVWPAFYTDVTDSYRLGRSGRIRTDLGGLYFNAIVAVGTFAVWFFTRQHALLLLVATQVLQMVQQLMPMLRFDGYHVLADLVGVPDLYQRIKPTLLGLWPPNWRKPEHQLLKPWAKAVILLWLLVTIPLMASMLFILVVTLPRMIGSAWQSLKRESAATADAFSGGTLIDTSAHGLQVFAVALPVFASLLILGRIGLRSLKNTAAWSQGSLWRRAVAAASTTVVVSVLAWAWYPSAENYRPIGPDETGRLSDLVMQNVPAARVAPLYAMGTYAQQRLDTGAPLSATFPADQPLPTRKDPQLAMVLVPTNPDGSTAAPVPGAAPDAVPTAEEQPWVFPFNEPLPPEEGDNQALAVNTTDNSVVYDVAFVMVWADGTEDVRNVNEALAYANCKDCTTVAVAFQVVFVMDGAQVIIPQNIAQAVNYDCYTCVTAAIANQLLITLHEDPRPDQLQSLAAIWGELTTFAQGITKYTLTEIAATLEQAQTQILEIFGHAPLAFPTQESTSPSPTTGESESASPSEGASPSGSTAPSPSPTPSTTQSGTPESSGTAPSPTAPAPTTSAPAPSPAPTSPAPAEGTSAPVGTAVPAVPRLPTQSSAAPTP